MYCKGLMVSDVTDVGIEIFVYYRIDKQCRSIRVLTLFKVVNFDENK